MVRYNATWFDISIYPKLNINEHGAIQIKQYIKDCIANKNVDYDKLMLPINHQIMSQEVLCLVIKKLFVEDKSTHSLVYHLHQIGLFELEKYHKPNLLSLN